MSLELVPYWQEVWPFILAGFGAQLIDGALGMAFGVISSTLLLTMGVSPAAASGAVHAVEAFTTAASGASHIAHRNIDWKLFGRLVIPGVIGGVSGAYLLTQIDGTVIKPFILAYLAMLGVWLCWRAFSKPHEPKSPRHIVPLGLIGGFLDASGGGGWGPVVTSNLLIQGSSPRHTIGTVNAVEFILTLTVSLTFLLHLGWQILTAATVGLLIGGVVAAPLGAKLAHRVRPRILLGGVGIVLTATSLFGVVKAIGLID